MYVSPVGCGPFEDGMGSSSDKLQKQKLCLHTCTYIHVAGKAALVRHSTPHPCGATFLLACRTNNGDSPAVDPTFLSAGSLVTLIAPITTHLRCPPRRLSTEVIQHCLDVPRHLNWSFWEGTFRGLFGRPIPHTKLAGTTHQTPKLKEEDEDKSIFRPPWGAHLVALRHPTALSTHSAAHSHISHVSSLFGLYLAHNLL
jgi:hypothetical protein